MKEYFITGFSDPEALEHTPTIRSMIKGCIDNHIKQCCKVQLDAATRVKKMYKILNEKEEIFWPPQKRQKTFMKTARKNSEDPHTFSSELWKKAKFRRKSEIIDRVECNHCHQKVKLTKTTKLLPKSSLSWYTSMA